MTSISGKPRIAIIGANGQVGAEVTILLKSTSTEVDVVAICRNSLNSVFLRQFGVTVRIGNVANPGEVKTLLGDCDVIVDFSLPRGLPSEFRTTSETIIQSVAQSARAGSKWVYCSSIMSLGMSDRADDTFGWHVFPRTIYGANKRFAEAIFLRASTQRGISKYVLRLGQVHGAFQGVSLALTERLRNPEIKSVYVPPGKSYALFTVSIVAALNRIVHEKMDAGTYTLVSNPLWEWNELAVYYAGRARNPDVHIDLFPAEKPRKMNANDLAKSLLKSLLSKGPIVDVARVFALDFLSKNPRLEQKAAGLFYKTKSSKSFAHAQSRIDLFRETYRGEPVKDLFPMNDDARASVRTAAEVFASILSPSC